MTRQSKTLTSAQEIEVLKAKLAELESSSSLTDDDKIRQDDYVKVMSLLPYNLNLSTKGWGESGRRTMSFRSFGEVKNILYHDLVDIMENHPNFLDAGYFYILNPIVIRQHGLNETYSKILTKEKLEEILLAKTNNAVALYSSANKAQQEVIVQFLVDKIRENSSNINLNIIDQISRLSGIDLIKKAHDEQELLKNEEDK